MVGEDWPRILENIFSLNVKSHFSQIKRNIIALPAEKKKVVRSQENCSTPKDFPVGERIYVLGRYV